MVLFHDGVAIVHLADGDRRDMLRIEAPDGCGIGLAAINRGVLGNAMTADERLATCLSRCSVGSAVDNAP